MSFAFCLFALIGAVSLCIVAFFLFAAGDLAKFKSIHAHKTRPSILPLISRYGDLIASPHELDLHLNGLKARLREKYQECERFKTQVHHYTVHLQKFDNFKKGCYEMQANMVKIEDECNDLQKRIEYFKQVKMRVEADSTPGVGVLGDADWAN